MRTAILPVVGLTLALSGFSLTAYAASLQEAVEALGASTTQSIEYSGTGQWFQFGQAPAPNLPWPPFDVSRYVANVDYTKASARVQIVRKQVVEAGRNRPAPTEQRADQYVNGNVAWNLAPPANSPPGTAPVATLQPAAVEERSAEIWLSPQGFLKAALANQATTKRSKGGAEISFSPDGKHRYVGTLNAKNQLEKVRTWIDNPVLGDTLFEARYSGYKDFGGVQFPTHIVRTQGGHPVLDIQIAEVKVNTEASWSVPAEIANASAPAITVTANKLSDGVYYLTGGTHHSVAIEQGDHIVLIEAPLNEARSQAVIAKVKETIPGKPIKYLVNTHAHFDHSGGLRTYVAEGTTIVTHRGNEAYYKKVWSAPHTLNPDSLAQAGKPARIDTFTGKKVLADAKHPVEIYPIAGSSHNDAFALIYLPNEKILIEGDAYTPVAANAPIPTPPNPYSVNLYDNIRKLKLDVDQIAALHGPRIVKLADLRAAIGLQDTATAAP